MQEVAARGGRIILITDEKGAAATGLDTLPRRSSCRTPTRSSRRSSMPIPVQLLAYHTAVFMGKDVDQPRNLAKSVTVE